MKGYAEAHGRIEAEARYTQAQTIRIAVWGSPDDVRALEPRRRSQGVQPLDDDFDETGLAEELASFGFIEVPRE